MEEAVGAEGSYQPFLRQLTAPGGRGVQHTRWEVGEDSPQSATGHEAERIVFVGVEAGHGG